MNTADISIHNVTSIVISDRREINAGREDAFFVRDIVITNDRGEYITITAYSTRDADEDTALKVQS